jgi:hypothetical protein
MLLPTMAHTAACRRLAKQGRPDPPRDTLVAESACCWPPAGYRLGTSSLVGYTNFHAHFGCRHPAGEGVAAARISRRRGVVRLRPSHARCRPAPARQSLLGAASVRPRVAAVHVHVPQPCLRVRPPGTLVRLPLARVRLRFAPAGRRSDLSRQRTTRVWRAEPHGARVPLRARRIRPLGDQADRLGRRRRQPARLDLSLVGSRGALPAASFAGSRSLAGPLPFCFGLLAKSRNVLPLDSLFRPLCALGDVMRRTILQFACVCRILTFICDPFGSSAKASRRSVALDRNARWCAKRSTPSVGTSLLAANPSRCAAIRSRSIATLSRSCAVRLTRSLVDAKVLRRLDHVAFQRFRTIPYRPRRSGQNAHGHVWLGGEHSTRGAGAARCCWAARRIEPAVRNAGLSRSAASMGKLAAQRISITASAVWVA